MGQHGGHVVIFPSWVPQKTIIDIMWDDAKLSTPRPRDRWDGELALLAGTFSTRGEWEWDAAGQKLGLWVPVPGGDGHRRLVATLDQFTFPPRGMTGTGNLMPGLAPVAGDLTMAWQGDPA
ncbi:MULTISPECIES: hypothetical protein [unclassified Streptomyces]|uniref:hypothetical protein n=1 Tax=unclassified Streptomyces TaxID=2593676 RepID=UPI0028C476E3|nr:MULTISPECIES: hypothetical protein [unclassified Streptomyces]WNO70379.1 hypothetical protein RPQ07_01510 [Streptomyces sp. AM8-1-1]